MGEKASRCAKSALEVNDAWTLARHAMDGCMRAERNGGVNLLRRLERNVDCVAWNAGVGQFNDERNGFSKAIGGTRKHQYRYAPSAPRNLEPIRALVVRASGIAAENGQINGFFHRLRLNQRTSTREGIGR